MPGVYVFNVPEREDLDRPTARLIKEFESIEGVLLLYFAFNYYFLFYIFWKILHNRTSKLLSYIYLCK